jgi:proteasome beta subunit
MPTVIAFESDGGVVVAADRTVVRGNTVASTRANRLLAFDDCGGAVVDQPDEVRRKLDVELRRYRTEHGESPTVEPYTRLLRDVVRDVGTDAVAAARDTAGEAHVRAVYADGSTLEDPPLALGTGAELALGRLEAARPSELAAAAEFASELLTGVAERDTRTGEEHDVWTLADAN